MTLDTFMWRATGNAIAGSSANEDKVARVMSFAAWACGMRPTAKRITGNGTG